MCFLEEIIVNSTTVIKSFLSDIYHEKIRKTEDVFPSDFNPKNPDVGDWITECVENQIIDQITKVALLLKLNFLSLVTHRIRR